jgi:hypothetical protein
VTLSGGSIEACQHTALEGPSVHQGAAGTLKRERQMHTIARQHTHTQTHAHTRTRIPRVRMGGGA